jgi:hypothetical protein
MVWMMHSMQNWDEAIPVFFVKRQVRLLKPNYLSGKNKQNFEVKQ